MQIEVKAFPVNLRNRMGRADIADIEAMYSKEEGDDIDQMIAAADSHVSVAKMKAVARLN